MNMTRQFLILVLPIFACVLSYIYAQTPYDNFAPEQRGKELLQLSYKQFCLLNINSDDSIHFAIFDVNTLTMSIYSKNMIIIGTKNLNPMTSKFLSIDKFTEKFPWQSPYCYAANNPVTNMDINGDSTFRFDSNGKYLGLFDIDQSGIRGVIGYKISYNDKNNTSQTMFMPTLNFTFNDPTFDVNQLSNMNVGDQVITILTEKNMNALMENSDIFSSDAQGFIDRYRFALNEFNGGKMDYSQRYFTHAFNVSFQEDGVGGFIIFGNSPQAYNLMDAGNFMWGQSMKNMGFYYSTAQLGSQFNENFHDASGDQRAIRAGYHYQINDNGAIMNSVFLIPQLSGRIKSKYY